MSKIPLEDMQQWGALLLKAAVGLWLIQMMGHLPAEHKVQIQTLSHHYFSCFSFSLLCSQGHGWKVSMKDNHSSVYDHFVRMYPSAWLTLCPCVCLSLCLCRLYMHMWMDDCAHCHNLRQSTDKFNAGLLPRRFTSQSRTWAPADNAGSTVISPL